MSVEKISKWLSDKCSERNANGFVMHYNGSIASSLLYNILSKTGKSITTVSTCNNKFSNENLLTYENLSEYDLATKLSILSDNKIPVSYYNFSELNYIRPWKHFTLIADLFPFAKMHKTDIDNLFAATNDLELESSKELFENNPQKDDLYSNWFEVTHEELEWAESADKIYSGIITKIKDPTMHPRWFCFTIRQKKIIAILNKNIVATNHKLTSTGLELYWKS